MVSRIAGMILGIGAVGVLVGALLFGLHPQAQEHADGDTDQVTPNELDLYISVYTAMQADHDLTLDSVLAQKGVPLDQFRNVERRVQKNDRLVRKVRDALTAQAKAHADAIAPAVEAAAPPPAPDKPTPHRPAPHKPAPGEPAP